MGIIYIGFKGSTKENTETINPEVCRTNSPSLNFSKYATLTSSNAVLRKKTNCS
ncbi:unnamed protein product [Ixodes pacificus]